MQSWFTFELDGETCRVEKEDIHRTLSDFLAALDPGFSHFSDRSAWEGGGLVVMGDIENDRHRFRIVDTALLLLPMLAGRQIWTAEGIRNAEPEHPVNLALRNEPIECGQDRFDAVVTLMFEGYYRPDLRRQGQINDQFDAVVTRTANVPAIRRVAAQVFASTEQLRHEAAQRAERSGEEATVWTGRKDIFGDRFTGDLFKISDRSTLNYVDGSKRRFHRPANVVELLRLRREYPKSRLVAGCTGLARGDDGEEWPSLISLEAVKELNSFITTEEEWEIGAAISLTEVAEHIGRECPSFNKILRRFGSRAVRNRATLGGYLATAWSAGQLSPLLMALNARVILLSDEGERDAPVSRFFTGNGGTILAPGELIRSVVIPRSNENVLGARGVTSRLCDVYSVGPRRNLCRPYATGAFGIELRDSQVSKAWIAYSGIAESPVRAREAEDFLRGKTWNEKTVLEMLPILNESLEVETSGDGDYRKQLVVTLFQKFFHQHPRPDSGRPVALTATGEFAKLDQPFFDALPT
ncbi:MAG: FAD binding domain-containing protein [Verrucomicrobiales bacterium]